MKNFDFYEFSAILAPGAVLLFGISLLYPNLGVILQGKDFTVGQLGLFVILSYVMGHLLQAIGNFLENIWWKIWKGMPTDWVRTSRHRLLTESQIVLLQQQLPNKLGLDESIEIPALNEKTWFNLTRQIYAAVAAANRNQRIDIFNANYGLLRGIASALIIILILFTLEHKLSNWRLSILVCFGVVIALMRMHRFGKYYARELFVQFLQLPLLTAESSEKESLKK